MNPFRIVLFSLCILLAGCASSPEAEQPPPRLIYADDGDGHVTLEWESMPGYVYTIYSQAEAGTDWVALETATRIPGTGGKLDAYDRVDPNKPTPRYRVLPEKTEK